MRPVSEARFGPIGVVGVGNMGGAIARAMLAAGLSVLVHDERRSAVKQLMADGAAGRRVARRLGGAGIAHRDRGRQRRAGTSRRQRARSLARPGLTLIVHSTVRPSTIVELAEIARRGHIAVVDAAVSGGRKRPHRAR